MKVEKYTNLVFIDNKTDLTNVEIRHKYEEYYHKHFTLSSSPNDIGLWDICNVESYAILDADSCCEIINNDVLIDVDKLHKKCTYLHNKYANDCRKANITENTDFDFDSTICMIYLLDNKVMVFYPPKYNTEEFALKHFNNIKFMTYNEFLIKRLLE